MDTSPIRLSRRNTFRAGGAGLAVLAGFQAQVGSARQPGVSEVVQDFIAGWRALDADQIVQTYASASRREDITSPVVFQGRDEIRRSLLEFFAAFENATIEHPDILSGPSQFAADTWIFTGDYVGTLPGLPSGNGQLLAIRGFTLIEVANNSIRRTVDYYDAYGLLVQLGAQPAFDPATPDATPTHG
jgi:steroid delta-isomerase-like uncharacterized protein